MATETALQNKLQKWVREAGGIFIAATSPDDDGRCAVLYAVLCSDRVFNCVVWPEEASTVDLLKRCVADNAAGKWRKPKAKSAAAGGK